MNINHVVAVAQVQVQRFELVVIDTFGADRHLRCGGLDLRCAVHAIHREHGVKDVAGDVLYRQHLAQAAGAEFRHALGIDQIGQCAGHVGRSVAQLHFVTQHQRAAHRLGNGGAAGGTVQADVPLLTGHRLVGAGNARCRTKLRAITAHDHQSATFAERGVLVTDLGIHQDRQGRGDAVHSVSGLNGVKHGLRWQQRFAVGQHQTPDLTRLGRAGEAHSQFVRRGAVNRLAAAHVIRANLQRDLEGRAIAVDDHQHGTGMCRTEVVGGTGIDAVGQQARHIVQCGAGTDRDRVQAGDTAQADLDLPDLAHHKCCGGQLVQIHERGARVAGLHFKDTLRGAQGHAGDDGLLLRGGAAKHLGVQTTGIDVGNRQVAVDTLEGDLEGIANLDHGHVVGIGFGRAAADGIKRRVDVHRGAIGVEHQAHGLVHINRRAIEGNCTGLHPLGRAMAIGQVKRQREGTGGDIRVDGHGLQVVDTHVDPGTILQGGNADINRGIRAGQQATVRGRLGPTNLRLIDASLCIHKAHRVGHIAIGACLIDPDVVLAVAVQLNQIALQVGRIEGVAQHDVGVTGAVGDVAALQGGIEYAGLAIHQIDIGAFGQRDIARGKDHTGVADVAVESRAIGVDLVGQCCCHICQGLHGTAIDRVAVGHLEDVASQLQAPALQSLGRAHQADMGGCGGAINRCIGHLHQRQTHLEAARTDVANQQRAGLRRRGQHTGHRRGSSQSFLVDQRGPALGNRQGRLASLHRLVEGKHLIAHGQVQGPDRAGERWCLRRINVHFNDTLGRTLVGLAGNGDGARRAHGRNQQNLGLQRRTVAAHHTDG